MFIPIMCVKVLECIIERLNFAIKIQYGVRISVYFFLIIFISLTSGVWFAAYTWWNYLYGCQMGPLVWYLSKIFRELM